MRSALAVVLVAVAMVGTVGVAAAGSHVHFVPNSQEFWDFSKNWTTNYGPAYRDTVTAPTDFLPCSGKFALCFTSGPEPLPCHMEPDGRFAKCTCTVLDDINFVLSTAILNYDVYLKTQKACFDNGQNCTGVNDAPVCSYLDKGKLIPWAQIISTFDKSATDTLQAIVPPNPPLNCDGPFAGCMTAPCTLKKHDQAECTCPVFWGHFQLYGPNAQCELRGDLIPSASYNPKHDPTVP